MRKYVVIAIDGPVCSGKSTIARLLASDLGFLHLNSGILYRGIALLALRKSLLQNGHNSGVTTSDSLILSRLALSTNFEFRKTIDEAGSVRFDALINGINETESLFTPDVSSAASKIAVFAEVRDILTSIQRNIASTCPVVLEGRDAGTSVFPDTPYKYYLNADFNIRVRRRYEQLLASSNDKGSISFENVAADINERDIRDTSRVNTPLTIASDARILNTSNLSPQDVVEIIKKDVLAGGR